ncbi:MAG TPA: nuclear transport factor 2 family protein [Amycolatopsis sp.]|nr:nuclear transport factor 2 family protein [Amycolatopsis sp.]
MTAADSALAWRAITVLHRYCRAIDHHDAEALKDVFSEDAELVAGEQTFAGRDTVVEILASLFGQRQWARHSVSNPLVDVEPDGTVVVRSYFHYVLSREPDATLGLGDYHVRLTEVDGNLLITRFHAAILDEVTVARRLEEPIP